MSNVGNKGECAYRQICHDYDPSSRICGGSYLIGDRAEDCDMFDRISVGLMHEFNQGVRNFAVAVKKLKM